MDAAHKQEFLQAVEAKVSELEDLLPLLMKDRRLAKGSPPTFHPAYPHFAYPCRDEHPGPRIVARRRSWRPGRRGVKRRQSDERQRVSRYYSGGVANSLPATNDGGGSGVNTLTGKIFSFPLLDHRQPSPLIIMPRPEYGTRYFGKLFHYSIMMILRNYGQH